MNKLVDLSVDGTQQEEVSLDLMKDYNESFSRNKHDLRAKIQQMTVAIRKFEAKDVMMNSIIERTYEELQSFAPNEFTRRGQKQTTLMKQLETQSLVHDTIMKYEDTIYKYQKLLMDIENNRISNFARLESLKKEDNRNEDNLATLLKDIQDLFGSGIDLTQSTLDAGNGSTPQQLLMEDIQKELEDSEYV